MLYEVITHRGLGACRGSLVRFTAAAACVITSYSIHYTKLYDSGRSKNVIVLPNGENVYPEVIEHKINTHGWVVESLVLENNGQIEAWIYPDYEYVDEQTAGANRADRRAFIAQLLRITSYNVCYTKLLRSASTRSGPSAPANWSRRWRPGW